MYQKVLQSLHIAPPPPLLPTILHHHSHPPLSLPSFAITPVLHHRFCSCLCCCSCEADASIDNFIGDQEEKDEDKREGIEGVVKDDWREAGNVEKEVSGGNEVVESSLSSERNEEDCHHSSESPDPDSESLGLRY